MKRFLAGRYNGIIIYLIIKLLMGSVLLKIVHSVVCSQKKRNFRRLKKPLILLTNNIPFG